MPSFVGTLDTWFRGRMNRFLPLSYVVFKQTSCGGSQRGCRTKGRRTGHGNMFVLYIEVEEMREINLQNDLQSFTPSPIQELYKTLPYV